MQLPPQLPTQLPTQLPPQLPPQLPTQLPTQLLTQLPTHSCHTARLVFYRFAPGDAILDVYEDGESDEDGATRQVTNDHLNMLEFRPTVTSEEELCEAYGRR